MDQAPQPKKTGGRILFADDDEQFRVGLGKRLKKAGFECDFAGTASEAIEQLKGAEYDVLLSDINMPGNSGLELIETVPAVSEGLPIILLTGNPTVATASRSVRLRVAAYLTKPPDFEELCGLLRSAVAERRSLQILKGSRRRLQDWDQEIEHIQKLLQQAPTVDSESVMQSYLRLNLRNLVVGLVELENLLIHDGKRLGMDEAVQKQELVNAVRKTVGVLEKTRDHFKSKELGELRKELEALVASRTAA
jgi:ActR/RegA family two-component response regulator